MSFESPYLKNLSYYLILIFLNSSILIFVLLDIGKTLKKNCTNEGVRTALSRLEKVELRANRGRTEDNWPSVTLEI